MIMLRETQLHKDASDWSTWICMINFLSYDGNNDVSDGDCDDDADDDDDDGNDNYIIMIYILGE